MSRKFILVVGVRPQFIKAAGLYSSLMKFGVKPSQITVFNTGQHYSDLLSKNIINELGIECVYSGNFNKSTHYSEIFTRSLDNLLHFLRGNCNSNVVVFGDANPTLVGALAAKILRLPLIHIEAGARRLMFEDEHYNSVITDTIADLKTCITERAFNCLKEENNQSNAIICGDLAIPFYENKIKEYELNKNKGNPNQILVSIHRPFNCNKRIIQKIYSQLSKDSFKVIWIDHPRVSDYLKEQVPSNNISIYPPQSHLSILRLLAESSIVLTDSGGLSREAYYFKKPILMRRNHSGWIELQEIGALKYINDSVIGDFKHLLEWAKKAEGSITGNIFDLPEKREEALQLILNLNHSERNYVD